MKAIAMGITHETFLHLNPKKMDLIEEGYQIRKKMEDENMWTMGIYIMRAVSVAVEHCLYGHKARSEYFDRPISLQEETIRRQEEPERELTEEEKKEAQEKVLMSLKIMMSNFETSESRRNKIQMNENIQEIMKMEEL